MLGIYRGTGEHGTLRRLFTCLSLEAKRVDGVETGRFSRGVIAKENADRGGKQEAAGDRSQRDRKSVV